MSKDFADRLKNQKQDGPKEMPPSSIAKTFRAQAPQRALLHRTTINVPVELHDQMRQEAYETGVSMTDQLINAWKAERGIS